MGHSTIATHNRLCLTLANKPRLQFETCDIDALFVTLGYAYTTCSIITSLRRVSAENSVSSRMTSPVSDVRGITFCSSRFLLCSSRNSRICGYNYDEKAEFIFISWLPGTIIINGVYVAHVELFDIQLVMSHTYRMILFAIALSSESACSYNVSCIRKSLTPTYNSNNKYPSLSLRWAECLME